MSKKVCIENGINENNKDIKSFSALVLERMDRIKEKLTNLETLEENLNVLQTQIDGINNDLKTSIQQSQSSQSLTETDKTESSLIASKSNSLIVLKCSNWEEFQSCAIAAQQVSVKVRLPDDVFEVYALKSNQIVAYVGPIPNFYWLLKYWVSANLKVSSERIFEGTLA